MLHISSLAKYYFSSLFSTSYVNNEENNDLDEEQQNIADHTPVSDEKMGDWSSIPPELRQSIVDFSSIETRRTLRLVNSDMYKAVNRSVITLFARSSDGMILAKDSYRYPSLCSLLVFKGARDGDLEKLKSGLRDLDLGDCSMLTEKALISLSAMSSLRKINLSRSLRSISTESLKLLATMPLIQLELDNIGIFDDGARQLANSKTLTFLSLRKTGILEDGAIALSKNTLLEVLILKRNAIGKAGSLSLSKNTTLRTLFLSRTSFPAWQVFDNEVMLSFSKNSTLSCLELKHNHITCEAVCELAKSTSITSLCLNGNDVGDEGAAALFSNTSLSCLSIEQGNVGTEGLKYIVNNTTLQSLYLSNNTIHTEGARALSQNGALTYLVLSDAKIGDKGLLALWGKTSLKRLGLFSDHFSSMCLSKLDPHSSLTRFDLLDSDVDAEGADALVALNLVHLTFDLGRSGSTGQSIAVHHPRQLRSMRHALNFDSLGALSLNGPDFLDEHTSLLPEALQSLTLMGCTGITSLGLQALSGRPIDSLNLYRIGVNDDGVKAVTEIQSLRALSIRGGEMSYIAVRALAQATQLSTLQLAEIDLTKNELGILNKNAALWHLCVNGHHILGQEHNGLVVLVPDTVQARSGVTRSFSLFPTSALVLTSASVLLDNPDSITVSDRPAHDANTAILLADQHMFETLRQKIDFDQLGYLSLRSNAFNDTHLLMLPENLQRLKLSRSDGFGRVGLTALTRHPSLTSLSLVDSRLPDDAIALLVERGALRILSLKRHDISVAAACALARSQLDTLSIDHSTLDQGVLAQLAASDTLTSLSLSRTDVDDDGAELLSHSASLTALSISDARLTSRALHAFSSIPSLTDVNLEMESDTPDGPAELGQFFRDKPILRHLAVRMHRPGAADYTKMMLER